MAHFYIGFLFQGPKPGSTKKLGKGMVHSIDTIEAAVDGSDSILDAYSTPNAKSTNKRLHTTPEKYALCV